jgi:acyl carrier protein
VTLCSLAPLVATTGTAHDAAVETLPAAYARLCRQSSQVPWSVIHLELGREGGQEGDGGPSSGLAVTAGGAAGALRRVVSAGLLPQVFVSPADLKAEARRRPKREEAPRAEAWPDPGAQAAGDAQAPPGRARPSQRAEYVPPRNSSERVITRVWQKLLGVEQLGVHDNFFEAGGHSLAAIQIVQRLSSVLAVKVQVDNLLKIPTVAGLAACIGKAAASKAAKRSPVVPLQPRGSRRPFFCVHPIGGGVFCFRDLARHLGDEQPFYALQAELLHRGRELGAAHVLRHHRAAALRHADLHRDRLQDADGLDHGHALHRLAARHPLVAAPDLQPRPNRARKDRVARPLAGAGLDGA